MVLQQELKINIDVDQLRKNVILNPDDYIGIVGRYYQIQSRFSHTDSDGNFKIVAVHIIPKDVQDQIKAKLTTIADLQLKHKLKHIAYDELSMALTYELQSNRIISDNFVREQINLLLDGKIKDALLMSVKDFKDVNIKIVDQGIRHVFGTFLAQNLISREDHDALLKEMGMVIDDISRHYKIYRRFPNYQAESLDDVGYVQHELLLLMDMEGYRTAIMLEGENIEKGTGTKSEDGLELKEEHFEPDLIRHEKNEPDQKNESETYEPEHTEPSINEVKQTDQEQLVVQEHDKIKTELKDHEQNKSEMNDLATSMKSKVQKMIMNFNKLALNK